MNLIPWRGKRGDQSHESTDTALDRIRDEFEGFFDRFFRQPLAGEFRGMWPERFGWGIRTDVAESDNDVVVKMELPGVDPKEIDLNVSGNVLALRGARKQEHEEKKRHYYYSERSYGEFSRTVQLPSSVDPNQVDAQYKDGVLTVTLSKRADAKPKRVTVRNA